MHIAHSAQNTCTINIDNESLVLKRTFSGCVSPWLTELLCWFWCFIERIKKKKRPTLDSCLRKVSRILRTIQINICFKKIWQASTTEGWQKSATEHTVFILLWVGWYLFLAVEPSCYHNSYICLFASLLLIIVWHESLCSYSLFIAF